MGSANNEATRTQQSIKTKTLSRLHHQTINSSKLTRDTKEQILVAAHSTASNPATIKTLTLVVAVATVLTIICLQENTAEAGVRTQPLFISFLAAALYLNAETLTQCRKSTGV